MQQNVCFYVYLIFSVDSVDYTLLGEVAHPDVPSHCMFSLDKSSL